LAVTFQQGTQVTHAVKSVSFDIYPGQTLALVGESGSGKSVTAHSILRLLNRQQTSYPQGNILYQGQNLLTASEQQLRALRSDRIAMVFQEPMSSLNPLHSIGKQISEILLLHKGMNKQQAQQRCIELLELVQIDNPQQRLTSYPHQLSG